MNRRRIFIAFAVLVPLMLFIAARDAASWRPIAIGPIIEGGTLESSIFVKATDREVLASFLEARPTLFDLKTGVKQVWPGGVTAEGSALWRLSETGAPQLLVTDATGTLAYPMPPDAHRDARKAGCPIPPRFAGRRRGHDGCAHPSVSLEQADARFANQNRPGRGYCGRIRSDARRDRRLLSPIQTR